MSHMPQQFMPDHVDGSSRYNKSIIIVKALLPWLCLQLKSIVDTISRVIIQELI